MRCLSVIALGLLGCAGTGAVDAGPRADVDGATTGTVDGAITEAGEGSPTEDGSVPTLSDAQGCVQQGQPANTSQMAGTWQNVTPSGLDLTDGIGAGSAIVDPARPGDVYVG